MNSDFAGKHALELFLVFLAPYSFTGHDVWYVNSLLIQTSQQIVRQTVVRQTVCQTVWVIHLGTCCISRLSSI